MGESHSVTVLIERLREAGGEEHERAAADLWRRYVSRLVGLARRHLAARVRRREDEEDVALRVYDSFCRRHRAGEYELGGRQDLWRLLVAIVQNKAANVAAHHGRARRDQRRERHDEARGGSDGGEGVGLLEQATKAEPTPDEAAALVDELGHLLSKLEPQLQQLVLWKLEGYTNEEIADKMGCAVRSVERKLARVRQVLGPQAAGMGDAD